MCNKLFAVLLVLGLVASVHAGLGDMVIHYTFDSCDDIGGYVLNNGGTLGMPGMGEVEAQSADGIQYAPSLIGEAIVLTNDGPTPPADPGVANNERCDTIDIEPGAETSELMAPFDNKTISVWFRQDLMINPDNHLGLWTGNNNYVFGTYCTYQSQILLVQDPWQPGVAPDKLVVRAGGRDINGASHYSGLMGQMPITLGDWHHVVLTLENICGAEGFDNALARTFVDGVQVGAGVCIRNSDAYRWGSYRDWLDKSMIGAYQFDEAGRYEAADGMTVDDFAIYEGALSTAQVVQLYENGLQGVAADHFDTPEPATIALLGMGALALLRKRS